MLNALSRRSRAPASTRTCPAISPAVRLRTRPILPVRQNAHAIAHPTWVEMQKVMAGVSGMNTDSMCFPSASLQQELLGAVGGALVRRDLRRGDDEVRGEGRPQIARQVGHALDIRDTTLVDPGKDLPGPEARETAGGKGRFEVGQVEFGQVGGRGHGISHVLSYFRECFDLTPTVQHGCPTPDWPCRKRRQRVIFRG